MAVTEWKYSGDYTDLEDELEDCQLCGHPDIRFQFEIVNTGNHNSLLVGSECIKKFDIPVYSHDGVMLQGAAGAKIVNRDRSRLIRDAAKNRVISILALLSAKDTGFNIDDFIRYYHDRGAFTPRQALLLSSRLKAHRITFDPRWFKVTIRRKRERDQAISMSLSEKRELVRFLLKPQIESLKRHKSRGIL